jgi:hypothetical protein
MKKISIAFLAAMSLASFGCPKKTSSGDAIAKLTELRDKMCACKDKACTEKVTEELTRWGQDQAKVAGDQGVKMSDDETKKSAAVSGEIGTCMAKVLAEAGGTMGGGPAAGGGSAAAGGADGSAGSADGSAAAGSAH